MSGITGVGAERQPATKSESASAVCLMAAFNERAELVTLTALIGLEERRSSPRGRARIRR